MQGPKIEPQHATIKRPRVVSLVFSFVTNPEVAEQHQLCHRSHNLR